MNTNRQSASKALRERAQVYTDMNLNQSDANVRLAAICASAEVLHKMIHEWLDDHGDGCSCDFCASDDAGRIGPRVANDLAGTNWALEIGIGLTNASRLPTDAEIDQIRAKHLAADDTDDAPVIITARAVVGL